MALDHSLIHVTGHLSQALESFCASKWADTEHSNKFWRAHGLARLTDACRELGFTLTPAQPEAPASEPETADLTMGR